MNEINYHLRALLHSLIKRNTHSHNGCQNLDEMSAADCHLIELNYEIVSAAIDDWNGSPCAHVIF